MRVLVACEFSGIVREEFRKKGHDAISCDWRPTEIPGPHIQGDILDQIWRPNQWNAIIAFYECTNLAGSGAKYFNDKYWVTQVALAYIRAIWNAPSPKICIENPVGLLSRTENLGPPTQYIEPWQFGHGETKKTCLWLKGLPLLIPSNIVDGREQRIWKEPPGAERKKNRSRTYGGVAKAMADQWG